MRTLLVTVMVGLCGVSHAQTPDAPIELKEVTLSSEEAFLLNRRLTRVDAELTTCKEAIKNGPNVTVMAVVTVVVGLVLGGVGVGVGYAVGSQNRTQPP